MAEPGAPGRYAHAEVVDRASAEERIRQLRRLATFLDDAIPIPGTSWRFGFDALIGLVPGIGDIAGFAASAYIILQAAQLRVSNVVIARMLLNTLIETAVGAIPFVGDAFDFVWKANRKNLVLLERAALQPAAAKRQSFFVLAATVVALAAIGALAVWSLVFLLRTLLGLFNEGGW